MAGSIPYWRLSGFYFFYFALLGTWLPYWSLYLKSLGYSSGEIGVLSALVMITKVVAPSLWGWLADTYHCRTRIIRLGSFLAAVAFALVYISQDFWWLALVVVSYSFFWNAVLSQFDVLTLSHLPGRYGEYSRIRVWGSIGFIIAVMAAGAWFDHHPIVHLLYLISLLLAAIWLSSLLVGEKSDPVKNTDDGAESLVKLVMKPAVLCFFATSMLLQFSHGPYYTFFSIYLESQGHSKSVTGMLWSLAVVAEVVLFIFMHRVLARYTLRTLLVVSLLLSALRWALIAAFAEVLPVLVFAQCLHAASFGSAHAVAVEVIRRFFTSHHGQGMALYSGLSFGAGGAAGALFSGGFWDTYPVGCCWVATLAAAIAGVLAWRDFEMPATTAADDSRQRV